MFDCEKDLRLLYRFRLGVLGWLALAGAMALVVATCTPKPSSSAGRPIVGYRQVGEPPRCTAPNRSAQGDGVLSVKEFKARPGLTGVVRIEGFLTGQYRCTPCPGPLPCEPCVPDHLVVTDCLLSLDEQVTASRDNWLYLVPLASELVVGQRYLWVIQLEPGPQGHGGVPTVGRVLQATPLP